MAGNLADITDEEFGSVLKRLTKRMILPSQFVPEKEPIAILLGGQSGAGKTTLHDIFRDRFDHNVIVINGDEYRSLHPRFHELQETYGDKSVDYTAAWSGQMTEALIDALSRIGYNLIIEGTLRTSDVPLSTARLLRQRGYSVSLALMAVKPEISLISCQIRYQQMRLAGTTPRATDPKHHMKIVDQIVANLAVLEDFGKFDGIQLFTRSEECLFPRKGDNRKASEVLEQALFGSWTAEEAEHFRSLQAKLDYLQSQAN